MPLHTLPPFVRIALLLGLALLAAAACKREEAPPAGALDASKYAAYFTSYPFGGQRLEWWQNKLAECSPGGAQPDAPACALLKTRAEVNGLVVDTAATPPTVKPGAALAATLMRRLEVK